MKTLHTIRKQSVLSNHRSRMIIKGFNSSENMYRFLNKQPNNDWVENSIPDYYGAFNSEWAKLKAGTYAYAGGQWHNVKSLDACLLAHI